MTVARDAIELLRHDVVIMNGHEFNVAKVWIETKASTLGSPDHMFVKLADPVSGKVATISVLGDHVFEVRA